MDADSIKIIPTPGRTIAALLQLCYTGALNLELKMAVQQNKKSPSKRGMHRSHDFLTTPALAIEPTSGETHLRHHISPNGFYRGRKIIKTKND